MAMGTRLKVLHHRELSSITICKCPLTPGSKCHTFLQLFNSRCKFRHFHDGAALPVLEIHSRNIMKMVGDVQKCQCTKVTNSGVLDVLNSGISGLKCKGEKATKSYRKKMPMASPVEEEGSIKEARSTKALDSRVLKELILRHESGEVKVSKKPRESLMINRKRKKPIGSAQQAHSVVAKNSKASNEFNSRISSWNTGSEDERKKYAKTLVRSPEEFRKASERMDAAKSSDADGMAHLDSGSPSQSSRKEAVPKKTKKGQTDSPGTQARIGLDMCSKRGDVMGAIALYDSAVRDGVKLNQYHYTVLLYLCSSAAMGVVQPAKSGSRNLNPAVSRGTETDELGEDVAECLKDCNQGETKMQPSSTFSNKSDESCEEDKEKKSVILIGGDIKQYALSRGFEIYERMTREEIPMNEATLTSVARMAMAMGNGDFAFDIVKQMKAMGITPRLRSYGPALFCYCNSGDLDNAFKVEEHMLSSGVYPEEPELEALLKVSIVNSRADKIYYLMHKLRKSIRQVPLLMAELIEKWFKSRAASRVGKRKWNPESINKAMESGGGGWHGLGWLGSGKWTVVRTTIGEDGICRHCKEKLVTIDTDPIETEAFANSVASIARKRERAASFQNFQNWLDYYGPFETVVDAANVGLFSQKRFSIPKVNAVVNAMRQKFPSRKWPLIIVHNRRIKGGRADDPPNRRIIEKWRTADALYATPTGSNDDWYWLYAAIKCKCLLVTNDEMRDHIFQMLGNDFFPRWKERHQVRFSFSDTGVKFHMPPSCSVVIQEDNYGNTEVRMF
ncbi:Proteinaceous RNase P 1 [Nymphaea thermarum]|nr:Proteinaceous RNase P 1 [Nymphaea thermarum]